MFLISCSKPLPSIPEDVLAEFQNSSKQMFNMSMDIDWRLAKNFEKHTEKNNPGDTILIYINSNGGEVDAAEGIINTMAGFKTICIADTAISAAFEIYQHCTVRVYMDRTLLLTHHHYMVFNERSMVTAPDLLLQGLGAYIQEIALLTKCATRMKMTYAALDAKIAENGGDWYIYGKDIMTYHAADYHIKNSEIKVKK